MYEKRVNILKMNPKSKYRRKRRVAWNKGKNKDVHFSPTQKRTLKETGRGSYYNQEAWLEEYYNEHERHFEHRYISDSSDSSGSDSDSDYEPSGNESDSSTNSEINSDASDENDDTDTICGPFVILCPHTLQSMLADVAVCRFCGGNLQIYEMVGGCMALGRSWSIKCENENCASQGLPSRDMTPKIGPYFEINRNLVLACRSIGKGRAAASTLMSVLNLNAPVCHDSWRKHGKKIEKAVNVCLEENLREEALNLKRFVMNRDHIPITNNQQLNDEKVKITAVPGNLGGGHQRQVLWMWDLKGQGK